MADLETLARRAGQATRAEAQRRARSLTAPGTARQRSRPVRRPVAVAALLAVVAVLAVLGRALVVNPGLVIEPVAPPDGLLEIPPVGEAVAVYLDDGTPVFVSHPEEGEVLVLDATSPHQENKLLAFCPTSGWFEDLYHGSKFTGFGQWAGGPAPTGLPTYSTERIAMADGEWLRVTGPVGDPPVRPVGQERGGESSRGPACGEDTGNWEVVAHQPPAAPPSMDGAAVPTDGWVWATLVLGGTDDDVRVCNADGTCADDAPAAAPYLGSPWRSQGGLVERVPGVWLARRTDQVVFLRRPAVPPQHDAGSEQEYEVFPVPEPGAATAVRRADGHPVFVTADTDGDVRVFDATSPATPWALLAWCRDTGDFVDERGFRFGIAGQPDGDAPPLRRYETELVEVGETRGVRIVADLTDPVAPPMPAAAETPSCAEPVRHLPGPNETVHEGVRVSGESWAWVRMRVVRDGDALRLCESPPGCPGAEDPFIVTPGAGGRIWGDGRVLLLVRGDERWAGIQPSDEDLPAREVEIRVPFAAGP